MADLDDFFAKKDRKKLKTKKILEQQLQQSSDCGKQQRLEHLDVGKKQVEDNDAGGVATETIEPDEWKEFVEVEKDYTGLKIGNLILNPGNIDSGMTPDCTSYEPQQQILDDELIEKKGPWRKLEEGEKVVQQQQQQPPQQEVEQIATKPVSGTYQPPSRRNQTAQSNSRLRGNNAAAVVAPDIHNKESFPTLSGGANKEQKR